MKTLITIIAFIGAATAWTETLEFDDCWGIYYAYDDKRFILKWTGESKSSSCKVTFHGYDQSNVLNNYKICIRATEWEINDPGVKLKYYADESVLADNLQKTYTQYSSSPMEEWCSDSEDYVDVQLTTTSSSSNQGNIRLEVYAEMTFDYGKTVGIIVGSVIGGIALIGIAVTVCIVIACRRRRASAGQVLTNPSSTVIQHGTQQTTGMTGYNSNNYNTNYGNVSAPPPSYYTAANTNAGVPMQNVNNPVPYPAYDNQQRT